MSLLTAPKTGCRPLSASVEGLAVSPTLLRVALRTDSAAHVSVDCVAYLATLWME
eukprot:s545_g1.t1